jgi:SAM-dependent methyltransferase
MGVEVSEKKENNFMIELRHSLDTREVYDEIYKGERIHQMDSFFIWICSLLKIGVNMSVLDISTGRGQMVQFARLKQANVVGLDFSMTGCQIAAERAPGRIVCSDAQSLPFPDEMFDVTTNIGSLEHFERMELGIREMARVLKKDGIACLTVPNTFGLRWNVTVGWKTGDVDDDGQPLQRYGTRRQWERLLQSNGLSVKRVVGYEHERAFPRTRRDFIMYLKHPKLLVSLFFFIPFIPVNMAGQFVFICKRKEG